MRRIGRQGTERNGADGQEKRFYMMEILLAGPRQRWQLLGIVKKITRTSMKQLREFVK